MKKEKSVINKNKHSFRFKFKYIDIHVYRLLGKEFRQFLGFLT